MQEGNTLRYSSLFEAIIGRTYHAANIFTNVLNKYKFEQFFIREEELCNVILILWKFVEHIYWLSVKVTPQFYVV